MILGDSMAWNRGMADMQVSLGQGTTLDTGKIYGKELKDEEDNIILDDEFSQKCLVCHKPLKHAIHAYCRYCGYDMTLTKNQKSELLNLFINSGWNIPDEKNKLYMNYKFYKPYTVRNVKSAISRYVSLIESLHKNNKFILFVSNDEETLSSIIKLLNIPKSNILDLTTSHKSLNNNLISKNMSHDIESFDDINIYLNEKYSLKLFDDYENYKIFSDLKILKNNCLYIEETDAKELNSFIKFYWQYLDSYYSNNSSDEYVNIFKSVKKCSEELNILKNNLIQFTDSLESVDLIFEYLHINCNNLSQLDIIENLYLLENNVNLIDIKESEDFINLLIRYQDINLKNISPVNYMNILRKKFKSFIDIIHIHTNNHIFNYLSNNLNNTIHIDSTNSLIDEIDIGDTLFKNSISTNLKEIFDINYKFDKIKESLENTSDDMDESVENMNNIMDNLFRLIDDCFNYFNFVDGYSIKSYIELFNNQFTESLNKCSDKYKIGCEINSFEKLININLKDIWDGFSSDLGEVKNKLEMDKKYSELRNNNIFSENTIQEFKKLPDENKEFLYSFKDNIEKNNIPDYFNLYGDKDMLIKHITELNNSDNSLKDYYNILFEINKILNSEKINQLLDSISLTQNNRQERILRYYEDIYFKYFNKTEFNISFNELYELLTPHIKFTKLINEGTVHKDSVPLIKNEIEDFLYNVDKLEKLSKNITKISLLNNISEFNSDSNIDSSHLINKDITYKIFISNLENAIDIFDKDYISYFDYVILDDNKYISHENRLQLFLISKNKLESSWLNK